MFLFFALIFAVPLSGLGRWTNAAYQELWERKRCQIAVDNAVLRAAALDKDTFQGLRAEERALWRLHQMHHPVHLCAKLPLTSWKCRLADKQLERAIRVLHARAWSKAQTRWQASATEVHLEGLELKRVLRFQREVLFKPSRALSLPVRTRSCAVCGFEIGWEFQWARAATSVQACASIQKGTIEWEEDNGHAVYRLTQ